MGASGTSEQKKGKRCAFSQLARVDALALARETGGDAKEGGLRRRTGRPLG